MTPCDREVSLVLFNRTEEMVGKKRRLFGRSALESGGDGDGEFKWGLLGYPDKLIMT